MTNDLEKVSGIGKATADRLKVSGIDTIEKTISFCNPRFPMENQNNRK